MLKNIMLLVKPIHMFLVLGVSLENLDSHFLLDTGSFEAAFEPYFIRRDMQGNYSNGIKVHGRRVKVTEYVIEAFLRYRETNEGFEEFVKNGYADKRLEKSKLEYIKSYWSLGLGVLGLAVLGVMLKWVI